MKKLVVALVMLGALAFGNGPARAQNCTSYQTSGPYYATPSWDQKLVYFQRFICLTDWNNEAVLDRETGLVWQRAPNSVSVGPTVYLEAAGQCWDSGTGGRTGWRLPTPEELMSLVDRTQSNPALPAGHPFQNVLMNPVYWSASVDVPLTVSKPGSGLPVKIEEGRVASASTDTVLGVWCVRGGSHVLTLRLP